MGMSVIFSAVVVILPVLAVIAALHDLTTMKIPNWISAVLIVAFFPAAFALGLPLGVVGASVGLAIAMLVVGMGMFAANWIGGGDAKLMAAAGLWLGWPEVIRYLVYTGLAGGILAVSLLALRSAWLRRYAAAGPSWMGRLATPGGSAPYGVAIAAGALAVFPYSPLLHAG